jgi:MFS transporter, FHS family, L-fucose permease
LRYVQPAALLAWHAFACVLLLVAALLMPGRVSIFSLTAIGLFNSIMFPTIFSMTLQGLGAATDRASGMLCMAVVGGAVIPVSQAMVADWRGLPTSFVVPLLCYLFILGYALMRAELRRAVRLAAYRQTPEMSSGSKALSAKPLDQVSKSI